jgi:hypothetical protein
MVLPPFYITPTGRNRVGSTSDTCDPTGYPLYYIETKELVDFTSTVLLNAFERYMDTLLKWDWGYYIEFLQIEKPYSPPVKQIKNLKCSVRINKKMLHCNKILYVKNKKKYKNLTRGNNHDV